MTRMEGRAQDAMVGVPVGGLGIRADKQGRKAPRPPHVFRYRGVGHAKVVQGHIALAQMVPLHGLVEVPKLVVDGRPKDLHVVVVARAVLQAIVADAGDGVPVAEVEIEQIVGRAQRVEQAKVVHLLVEVIDILGQQGAAAALKVAPGEQATRLLHQRD